ncbi:T9SS type A sorting domain-containing protein [Epilithonimonas sp. JDS]|uniref:T9SS type A sorting domain-containing protein n=1 Tax=Epilithonimonas sp. JDS TaxID=2902797 RepID=UPI001E6417A8|nr:T9SS type A sorting domain-containing protein [Epilithonimonas sp. JDS]MCD9855226.1 T9SS type A sorting domain-containing protein [Epilithonimonas sp. JDS]
MGDKVSLSNGTTAFTTGNGTDWTPEEGSDGVFIVSYVCETPSTQVVLIQGLESGAALPDGNTVVIHNLIYEGAVIDTCVFNVKINKILNSKEVSQKQISFYPNPVKDILKRSYFKEIENVVVYDMSGKKVFSKIINRKEADINLSNFTSGTYTNR